MTPMMTTTMLGNDGDLCDNIRSRLMWAMMVTYVITYDDPNDDNDDLTADAGDDVDLCFFLEEAPA